MITLDTQNFLSPKLSKKLIASGIDMSDSRYLIVDGKYIIERIQGSIYDFIPTYTLPEILYKLPECDELEYWKDAPFYYFRIGGIECKSEYPIEAAANLLCKCGEDEDLWYVKDISVKQ